MAVRREKEWEVAVSDAGRFRGDFLHFRIVKVDGRLVDFLAQYEITVDGKRVPVVRYDGSHARCHYDCYDRSGTKVEQRWLAEELSTRECLTLGQRDIKENWSRHRARYFGEVE